MNIYLLSQDVNIDYDTYDSAVVCAKNESAARMIHPSPCVQKWGNEVRVVLIGKAVKGTPEGVICASYNAG